MSEADTDRQLLVQKKRTPRRLLKTEATH
eukprot:COSAG02_NODE_46886_length_345_cov_0.833333_1_plen_28_part_10